MAHFGTDTLGARYPGARPVYVAQLSPAGQWLTAIAAADSSVTEVGGLVLDGAGEVTLSGSFASATETPSRT